MEYFKTFNDFFLDKNLSIPAIQMIIYVAIINLLMLFQSYRTSFLVSLVFTLYWLVVLNQDTFISLMGEFTGPGYIFLGVGVMVLMVSMVAFLSQSGD